MFNTMYIYELLKGQLSEAGYNHFVNAISRYTKKFNWPRSIVAGEEGINSSHWSHDDIKELCHQYFEWVISKGKLEYLNKIPESYLSYYFLQILISFIANRIKEEQRKKGLSFQKTHDIVTEIARKELISNIINGVEYYYNHSFNANDLKTQNEAEKALAYLSKIPIQESTKHFKPLIKIAIDDIFNTVETPMTLKELIKYTFALFDQQNFKSTISYSEPSEIKYIENENPAHIKAITKILSNVTKEEARIISEYIFQNKGVISLSELALKYNIPKSTLHNKMETFKKKIAMSFIPDNEEDGLFFIKKLAKALDDLSN